jgi:hypothetical protein
VQGVGVIDSEGTGDLVVLVLGVNHNREVVLHCITISPAEELFVAVKLSYRN